MQSGWYDKPLTQQEKQILSAKRDQDEVRVDEPDLDAEALAALLTTFIHPLIEDALGKGDTQQAAALIDKILATLQVGERISQPIKILRYYFASGMVPGNFDKSFVPSLPLSEHSLFTGRGGQSMLAALKEELQTADEAWLVVSFIRSSAVKILEDDLRRFCNAGHKLYVLGTTYTGATQAQAVATLLTLPNCQVRISFDSLQTRMHAKGYLFVRHSGFSTAFVGSSNLSAMALTKGLEWNLRISAYREPQLFDRLLAACRAYCSDDSFVCITSHNLEHLQEVLARERQNYGRVGTTFDTDGGQFKPELLAHQRQILRQLQAQRATGNYRNLVVAATGTGKTMLAAFDFYAFTREHPQARLLFVAHRVEILQQAQATFARVLSWSDNGEILNAEQKPTQWQYVFASISTLNRLDLKSHPYLSDPKYFSYIVIDEVHHGMAHSYERLFDRHYFDPQILLGLTATPERMDGRDLLPHFNHTISAEIRLPEAIERGLLVPFIYYGVSDNVDLKQVAWKRGNYDTHELGDLYTKGELARARADLIINKVRQFTDGEVDRLHALGFCVNISHAKFMADCFNQAGIPSKAVHSELSDPKERKLALEALKSGEVKFLFTVDMFNEGVDIPCVNVVLFLRPTQSLTIFIQQLGRGLRRYEEGHKEALLVLDFIGQANKEYDFAAKFNALLTRPSAIKEQIKHGFPDLPLGCALSLERKAKEAILETLSVGQSKDEYLLSQYQRLSAQLQRMPAYNEFFDLLYLNPALLYAKRKSKQINSFYRLQRLAGEQVELSNAVLEEEVCSACLRLRHVNDVKLIHTILQYLDKGMAGLDALQMRYLQMFYVSLFDKQPSKTDMAWQAALEPVRQVRALKDEICGLMHYRLSHAALSEESFVTRLPLTVYGTYTTQQALCAGGISLSQKMNGVSFSKSFNSDFIFVTLQKERGFGRRTRYADGVLDKQHLHWQSPNATKPDSGVGRRYVDPKARKIIFVRTVKEEGSALPMPYTCLGTGHCQSYSGSKPISMQLRLDHPIPDVFLGLGTMPS